MTADFYRAYLREQSRKRTLLYGMNPNKIQACQYLIDFHEKRGDKIIVFSDNVYVLAVGLRHIEGRITVLDHDTQAYARKLGKPFIYGGTGQQERLAVLKEFQRNSNVSTIFLSKVGHPCRMTR